MTVAAASIPKLPYQTTPAWNLKIADWNLPTLDMPLANDRASVSDSSTETPFYEMGRLPYWSPPEVLPGLHGFLASDSSTEHPYRNDEQRIAGQRYRIRFFQHVTTGRSEVLFVDFGEVEADPQYQQIVDELRNTGRELLAEEVIEMLRASQEDSDEADIQFFSLQAMARFLIKQKEFADPIVGPDPHGIMQIEWHIMGNGLLVMAFVEDGQVHCVAQADASPQGNQLNVSVQLAEDQAVEEFGHLVPLR